MANTTAATGAVVQQWLNQYFTEYLNQNFFSHYYGSSKNAIIQINEELTKMPGDAVTFHLINRLTNAATTGSSTLEGNEEALTQRSFKITIDQERHAVLIPDFENQKTAFDLMKAGKEAIKDYFMELDRDKIITALGAINGTAYGSASEANKDAWLVDNADRVLFGAAKSNNSSNDHSASLANIDNTNDQLDASAISLMKRMAKTADPKIRPFRPRKGPQGSEGYVLFAPSLLVRDLANDSDFQQANREARSRGKDNPLFKGADYIYENVAVVEVEDIGVLSGVGAGSIDVAPCYLCGAQAVGMAFGKRPEPITDVRDYGDKKGTGMRQWYDIAKMTFGSGSGDTDDLKDHGVLTGYFAAVADS